MFVVFYTAKFYFLAVKKSMAKSIRIPMVLTNLLSDSFSRFRFTTEVRTLLTMCNDLFSGLS